VDHHPAVPTLSRTPLACHGSDPRFPPQPARHAVVPLQGGSVELDDLIKTLLKERPADRARPSSAPRATPATPPEDEPEVSKKIEFEAGSRANPSRDGVGQGLCSRFVLLHCIAIVWVGVEAASGGLLHLEHLYLMLDTDVL
jgi:hypothetical protein